MPECPRIDQWACSDTKPSPIHGTELVGWEFFNKLLEGKVAVITGAGTGIGQGIALTMANTGASIVVDYVGKAEIAQDTIDQITKIGGKVIGVDADISNPNDVSMLIQKTLESFRRLEWVLHRHKQLYQEIDCRSRE